MPRAEKMPGIQSTKLTWKLEPLVVDLEKVAASMRVKRAMENYQHIFCQYYVILEKAVWLYGYGYTDQGSCNIDACCAGVGAV